MLTWHLMESYGQEALWMIFGVIVACYIWFAVRLVIDLAKFSGSGFRKH